MFFFSSRKCGVDNSSPGKLSSIHFPSLHYTHVPISLYAEYHVQTSQQWSDGLSWTHMTHWLRQKVVIYHTHACKS